MKSGETADRPEVGGEARRAAILERLRAARGPVKGAALAEAFGISRQTLVQDIALLRRDGHRILSTIRGYVLEERPEALQHEVLGIHHPPERLERELAIIVAHGVTVKDVMIEHPVYGRLTAELDIRTPEDIRAFVARWRASSLPLFSEWTGGFHYHTLVAPEAEAIERAIRALIEAGFPVERT
ncbi:MAG: transcription repressor NadR [Hydrogenibacillus schlegelii]|nr:transcription repressor NadR [Hydrogenibacillus schlegelii]